MDRAVHQQEAAFHDAWAAGTSLEDIMVRECFEAPTALENRFILTKLGALQGKKLLDVGAGLGESAVYFALQGAQVTAIDVSPVMVQTILKLGQRYGVQLEGIVSSAEELNVPEAAYDVVYVVNTIHHVRDRRCLFRQIRRALKPDGIFISYDPLAYNPLINVYRRMATHVRTPDESPLTVADLKLARQYFSHVQHREFWISALLLFVKYFVIDRVHPNQDRYWKRILRETPESLRWWMPLRALDRILCRVSLLRWMAWNTVVWGTKD